MDRGSPVVRACRERVLPILASDAGVFVAASTLGAGRIVAFSGQDFISSNDTSTTLIGIEGNDTLVRNAVRWASLLTGSRQPRMRSPAHRLQARPAPGHPLRGCRKIPRPLRVRLAKECSRPLGAGFCRRIAALQVGGGIFRRALRPTIPLTCSWAWRFW